MVDYFVCDVENLYLVQDSTLYFCTEDYTGVIPHWMVFLLTMGMWKERTRLPWKSFLVTMMGRNRYSDNDSLFKYIIQIDFTQ